MPEQSPSDAYDIGGEAAQVPSPAAPQAAGEAASDAAAPAAGRPRDPVTGHFLSDAQIAAQAAAPPAKHSQTRTAMARKYGFSQAQIDGASPEELREMIEDARLDRQAEAFERRLLQPAPESPPAPEPAPARAEGDFDFSQINDKAYDGPLAAGFQALLKRVEALESQQGQMTQRERAREARTLTERCDQAFAKHKDLLGDEPFDELQKDDPKMARREAVIALAKSMPKGAIEARIDQAVKTLFAPPDVTPKPEAPPGADAAPAKPAPEWEGSQLRRPTHRQAGAEPPGRSKAEKAVARWQQENGVTAGSADDLKDEFPR